MLKYDQFHINVLYNILISEQRIIWDHQYGLLHNRYTINTMFCIYQVLRKINNGNVYSALTIHKLQDSDKGEIIHNILTQSDIPENSIERDSEMRECF